MTESVGNETIEKYNTGVFCLVIGTVGFKKTGTVRKSSVRFY
jgi:hypothetical protein